MKKILSVILVLIMSFSMAILLAGCKEEHIHTYTEKTVVPTCTSQGSITYTCECGDSYVEYTQQLEHTYNCEVATSKYLKSNATCTSKAVYYKSCSCGETGTSTFEHGNMLEHTVVIDNRIAETCTNTGLTEGSHCLVCNKTIIAQEIIPAQHNMSNWIIDQNPTCTTNGSQHKECMQCHTILKTENLKKLGHNIGLSLQCSRCDYQQICELDTTYIASDNLTITLNSFTYTEYTGYIEYSISYTIENQIPDSKIHYGLFSIIKSDGSSSTSGGWTYLYYGEKVTRGASWKMLKNESPVKCLQYNSYYMSLSGFHADRLHWLPPEK